jgi:ribosomal protein L37AE/L43A
MDNLTLLKESARKNMNYFDLFGYTEYLDQAAEDIKRIKAARNELNNQTTCSKCGDPTEKRRTLNIKNPTCLKCQYERKKYLKVLNRPLQTN